MSEAALGRLRHQLRNHAGVLDAGELEVEAEVVKGSVVNGTSATVFLLTEGL